MNSPATRRQFIGTTALLPFLAATGFSSTGETAGPEVAEASPSGSRLRTSLNAYSFLELLNANAKDKTKGIDLFGVCTFCAKAGFDAVDLTGYFFPGYPAAPDDSYIFALKRHTFKLGLSISGTGVRNEFTSADPRVRAEGVQRIKTWIEVAAKLGAPTVRAFADSQPPFKNWQEASGHRPRPVVEAYLAEALRECAEHGKKFGVFVAVQNHGDFISTGPEHLSLLKRVNHEWCAALVDTGKYMTDDPYKDIELLAPLAVNWQIKETTRSDLASPRINMGKLVGIIRRSGYSGFLPIETLSMRRPNYDSSVETTRMLGELRAALASTPSSEAAR